MIYAVINGTVADGSGGEPFPADVLIKEGKISEVRRRGDTGAGKNSPAKANGEDRPAGNYLADLPEGAKVIDAAGKMVTPGFVDIHRHCDLAMYKDGFGKMELAQGITSIVTGNCGLTAVPYNPKYGDIYDALLTPIMGTPGQSFSNGGAEANLRSLNGEFFSKPSRLQNFPRPQVGHPFPTSQRLGSSGQNFPRPQVGHLIGSCSIRIAVKGMDPSPFTQKEMDTAIGYLHEAMDAGALGLSFGLMYYPEYYTSQDELVTLAKAAASRGGILTCHIRGEGDSVVESVREITDIARRADIPLQISHFKACGVGNWGVKIHEAIEVIEERRDHGGDIQVDVYPYDGGATTMMSLIPPGFMKPTVAESVAFMGSSAGAIKLEETLSKPTPGWDNYIQSLGFDRIVLSAAGKSIGQIMKERPGLNPYEFICGLMAENNCEVGVTVMSMSQADVDTVARLPYSIFISDALYPQSGLTHPRAYGAFPKVLRDMVRERRILSLPEAVKKMTSMPAERLRLGKRGLLREGYIADVCVFPPENIRDNATWQSPAELASGMDTVFVRGELYEN